MPAVRTNESGALPRKTRDDAQDYQSSALALEGETWRSVPGYEKAGYEASTRGRIRKHSSTALKLLTPTMRNHNTGVSGKYLRVDLYDGEGRHKTLAVHTIVALTFHGSPASPSLQVAHLNGDSLDNRPENLAWVTAKENSSHQLVHGTRPYGDKHPNAKICRYAMLLIHHLIHQEGWTGARVSAVSDLSETSVRRIATGKLRKIPPRP